MAKRSGLGKGLESLMGGADVEVGAMRTESVLPLSQIKTNKNQPRKSFDQDKLNELADSIDRKSTRLNSSHASISYAVFCLKKKIRKD